ncbi:hypothetical protein OAM32_01000 [Alphaproteobacteria bacterium]|nr:hypothetical protein [Alphaproteobacteria bacterium]
MIQILMLMLFRADLPVFIRDQKHAKNQAKHHRIAIFTADAETP